MDVRGKKVTVVGMGRTALALVRLLLREGAEPFVTEAGPADAHSVRIQTLDALGVPWECGGHRAPAFRTAALVIPSPGVPPKLPAIRAAVQEGARLMGELAFASQFAHAPIIAVTGTNGKTTTTEWLRHMVAGCGHSVFLAGNNDRPLSEAVCAEAVPEYYVAEVSSYQLELNGAFRPWLAAVLNVTPDHLERHGTIDAYAEVKARIFAHQGPGDVAVVNGDDPFVRSMPVPEGVRRVRFSLRERPDSGVWLDGRVIRFDDAELATLDDIPLPGRHNLENAFAALALLHAGGFGTEGLRNALKTFKGVEHRIERVAHIRGVDYYNDSKSTNTDSLRVALDCFTQPVVLVCGGRGKGTGYAPLREWIRSRVRHVVAIGEDAPRIAEAFSDLIPVVYGHSMDEAVTLAAAAAQPGDAVLLSPACASFDMFDNFEHRGRVFKECVARYQQGGAA